MASLSYPKSLRLSLEYSFLFPKADVHTVFVLFPHVNALHFHITFALHSIIVYLLDPLSLLLFAPLLFGYTLPLLLVFVLHQQLKYVLSCSDFE